MFRLREGVRKMEEKHFSEHNEEHVEFLPVEWRSKLTLDGGVHACCCLSCSAAVQSGWQLVKIPKLASLILARIICSAKLF